jgi:hypothetical protein
MDPGLMPIDWKQLFTTVGPAIQQILQQQLTPEQLQALRETEVYVTQRGKEISVDVRFREDDPNADAIVQRLVVSGLANAMPQVAKVFGCRALFRKLEEG